MGNLGGLRWSILRRQLHPIPLRRCLRLQLGNRENILGIPRSLSVPFESPYMAGIIPSMVVSPLPTERSSHSKLSTHLSARQQRMGAALHQCYDRRGHMAHKGIKKPEQVGTTITSFTAMADGYLTFGSSDGYMYVIGKGQSATTVTAPRRCMPKGNGIVIKGTVFDLSPAQPGTPCVSEESMAHKWNTCTCRCQSVGSGTIKR